MSSSSLRVFQIAARSITLTAILSSGCVGNPARGVPANQAPLRVVLQSGTDTVQVERATGNTYDADGNLVAQQTEFATESHEWSDFDYYQGPDKLDEQDFYRLSLDQSAYDEIVEARRSARRNQMLGLPLAVVGLGGAIVASYAMDRESPVAIGTIVAGSVVGAIGTTLYTRGMLTMQNRHLLPAERASAAADVVESCRSGQCVTVKNRPRRPPITGSLSR